MSKRDNRLTVDFPEALLNEIESRVKNGEFRNKSEAVREACRAVFTDHTDHDTNDEWTSP